MPQTRTHKNKMPTKSSVLIMRRRKPNKLKGKGNWKNASRQQSEKTKSPSNPGGRRRVSKIKQTVGSRKELHPRNWKQTRYHKIKHRIRIYHRNLKRKIEELFFSTITSLCSPQFQEKTEVEIFACDKINQNQGLIYIHDYNIPHIEDYGSELKKEYNLLDVKRSNMGKNQKHHFFSNSTDFQRKRTTENHRNPGRTSKN